MELAFEELRRAKSGSPASDSNNEQNQSAKQAHQNSSNNGQPKLHERRL